MVGAAGRRGDANRFPLSILSQLQQGIFEAAAARAEIVFQFFPSCSPKPLARARSRAYVRLSILSQLQLYLLAEIPSIWERASVQLSILSQLQHGSPSGSRKRRWVGFQFFPSCSQRQRVSPCPVVPRLVEVPRFQFFPSCSRDARRHRPLHVDIPFNSFPVAAETLTAYPLINLSTANFEVSENLPALPPDTCVGSRKPFPNSRRKEGIWRERNDN